MTCDHQSTRLSWNAATRNHNAHKGDQAAFFRAGGDVLFDEELDLLGELDGQRVVHLQCNAGQDTLGLVRRGARVTGVDFSEEAIAFARALSLDADLSATFIEAEVVEWLHSTGERFDVAFTSYGATCWLPDLQAWASGVHRVLEPGGCLVYVEYHPLIWSWGPDLKPTKDDYFSEARFDEPVRDYVADTGSALGAVVKAETLPNHIPAYSYQHGLATVINALATAGFTLERLREYPYVNGPRLHSALVPLPGRRWGWPPGIAPTPLMYGLRARR